eukprot:4652868-Prorocentrum_lima.AAC.1
MTSSLVGSEMCIRDSLRGVGYTKFWQFLASARLPYNIGRRASARLPISCLLYTSDAADDM